VTRRSCSTSSSGIDRPWGHPVSAREINRSFGISNMPLDGGGVMVGERIQLIIEVEAVLNP
jgi:hypothetical protein